MKINYLWIGLLSALFITSCSNEEVKIESENYSNGIVAAKPYISPGMQNIINILNTTNQDSIDICKLIPSLGATLIRDAINSTGGNTTLTRSGETDGTTVFTGYENKSILFSTTITIPEGVSSSLGESLELESYFIGKKLYMRCWAITNSFYFSSNTYVKKKYVSGDKIGYDPDLFDQNLTSDTYLPRGYHLEENLAGRLYSGTTYVFDFGLSTTFYSRVAPNIAGPIDLNGSIDGLQWRMYAIGL